MNPTGKQVKQMAEVLSAQYETVEEAAAFALEEAWRLYEERSNFVVVGQLVYSDGVFVKPDDVRATKVALGPYGTAGDAKAAGESLAVPSHKGETFRWWLLPVHHGTPAAWHKARKAAADEAKREALNTGNEERVQAAKTFTENLEHWPQESLI